MRSKTLLTETSRANFPLTVIMAPKDTVLVKGLPAVATEVIQATPKSPRTPGRKRAGTNPDADASASAGAAVVAAGSGGGGGGSARVAPLVQAPAVAATPSRALSAPAVTPKANSKKRSCGKDTPGVVPDGHAHADGDQPRKRAPGLSVRFDLRGPSGRLNLPL